MMRAHDLINWSNVSVVLTGDPNKIRSNRENKKFSGQIQPLLDMIQEWADKKGEGVLAKVEIKVKEENSKNVVVDITDFEQVDAVPVGRVAVTGIAHKGVYRFDRHIYTNKVIEGKLAIYKWRNLESAIGFLDSIKK